MRRPDPIRTRSREAAASCSAAPPGRRFPHLGVCLLALIPLSPASAFAGRVSLAWDRSPDPVAGYTVYYGTSSGNYTASANTTQTTLTIQGLTNGVRYYFVVKAFSSSGVYSVGSNEVNGLPANLTPTLTNPGARSTQPGPFSLTVAASDPDGDRLVYSATGLPSGLAISSSSGTISGTVAAGTYNITVTVSDGALQASATFTLIAAANRAPTLQTLPDQSHDLDDVVGLQPAGSDPDGDTLVYTATGLPPGLSLASATGRITGTATTIGVFPVTVTVSDGSLSASRSFTWTIVALPPPVPFTDDPLVSGVHAMRLVHITELRTRIDALRLLRGLGAASWTPLLAGSTVIRASHIIELRSALNAVYVAAKRTAPVYTDSGLSPGMAIKAAHVTELRAAVRAID